MTLLIQFISGEVFFESIILSQSVYATCLSYINEIVPVILAI